MLALKEYALQGLRSHVTQLLPQKRTRTSSAYWIPASARLSGLKENNKRVNFNVSNQKLLPGRLGKDNTEILSSRLDGKRHLPSTDDTGKSRIFRQLVTNSRQSHPESPSSEAPPLSRKEAFRMLGFPGKASRKGFYGRGGQILVGRGQPRFGQNSLSRLRLRKIDNFYPEPTCSATHTSSISALHRLLTCAMLYIRK